MSYSLVRSLLFRLDPERAHHLTLMSLALMSRLGPLNPLKSSASVRPRTVMGLTFPNPVGLAAGLDKDGQCINGLAALGFGFLEVGTVTPKPQPGNPKPRLFRLVESEALINRMGFNNDGVDALVRRVKAAQYPGILGINLGKNKDTPIEEALSDYQRGLERVFEVAGYVTINLSSPNTPGLRALQGHAYLDGLIGGIMQTRDRLSALHGRAVPIVVKIAPDLGPEALDDIAACLLRWSVDGVIATNTTIDRPGLENHSQALEAGGLSGRPLFSRSTEVVLALSNRLGSRLPIIACGGIFTADDAQRKLDAGASLIQLYSGLVYRGPELVRELLRKLT